MEERQERKKHETNMWKKREEDKGRWIERERKEMEREIKEHEKKCMTKKEEKG